MDERISSFLNCQESLLKVIPIFMDVFIQYYGEEYREEIEKKFSQTFFIGYQTPDAVSIGLSKLELFKTNKMMESFIHEHGLSLSLEDITDGKSFVHTRLQPIFYYCRLRDSFLLGEEGRKKRFIEEGFQNLAYHIPFLTLEEYQEIYEKKAIPEKYQSLPKLLLDNFLYYMDDNNIQIRYEKDFRDAYSFLVKICPSITCDNFEDLLPSSVFDEANLIANSYPDLLEDFHHLQKKFQSFYDDMDMLQKKKSELTYHYQKKLIEDYLDLIPEDKRSGIEDYFQNPQNYYLLDPYVKYFFGSFLYGGSAIDCFSEAKEEALQSSLSSPWMRDEIKKNRMEYFKKNGIDLGDSYEDYLQNEEVKKLWPDASVVSSFLQSRDYYLNQFYLDYSASIPSFQNLRHQIDSLGLLDKDDPINARLYTKKETFVCQNIVQEADGYSLLPMVVINFDHYDASYIDHFIVHELNHLFEMYLHQVYDDHYVVSCGWEFYDEKMRQDEVREVDSLFEIPKREYELFNEIINELIAQDISRMMKQRGIHIFDSEKSSYRCETSYEKSLFLVKDFFLEFKDVIIKSRQKGNIQLLFDVVGKENFDELNHLFSIYFEKFNGFSAIRLKQLVEKQEDNELTRIYNDLVQKSREIFERMKAYHNRVQSNNYNL